MRVTILFVSQCHVFQQEALENWYAFALSCAIVLNFHRIRATVVLILIIVIFTAAFEFCTTGILKWYTPLSLQASGTTSHTGQLCAFRLSKQGLPGLRNMLNAVFKELAILGYSFWL